MGAIKKTFRANGIVTRISPYKDKDEMVEILTNEGFLSFLAKGVKNKKSKNIASLSLLSESEFLFEENNNGYLYLKEGLVKKAIPLENNYPKMVAYSLISELNKTLINKEDGSDIYPFLKQILTVLSNNYDPISASLLYFAYLLKKAGYGLNVSSCIRCNCKMDISGINYFDGGFICKKDIKDKGEIRDSETLKIIRYIFLCPLEKVGTVSFPKNKAKKILQDLIIYLENISTLKLKSSQLISVL